VTVEVSKVHYTDREIWITPREHSVFIGSYMTVDTGGHPDKIKCKGRFGVTLVLAWSDPRAEDWGCRAAWYKEHTTDVSGAASPTP
jgi:hypothetical protein